MNGLRDDRSTGIRVRRDIRSLCTRKGKEQETERSKELSNHCNNVSSNLRTDGNLAKEIPAKGMALVWSRLLDVNVHLCKVSAFWRWDGLKLVRPEGQGYRGGVQNLRDPGAIKIYKAVVFMTCICKSFVLGMPAFAPLYLSFGAACMREP